MGCDKQQLTQSEDALLRAVPLCRTVAALLVYGCTSTWTWLWPWFHPRLLLCHAGNAAVAAGSSVKPDCNEQMYTSTHDGRADVIMDIQWQSIASCNIFGAWNH